jgi:hypothetical protein
MQLGWCAVTEFGNGTFVCAFLLDAVRTMMPNAYIFFGVPFFKKA